MSPLGAGGGGGSGGGNNAENRAIEQRIIRCLANENNLGNSFTYNCTSQNHVEIILIPSRNRRVLPTRDITVRLENPSGSYIVTYNTADNTHTVSNPPGSFGLSPENLQKVLHCITSNHGGGKRRRSKHRTKRVKRKYSHRRR